MVSKTPRVRERVGFYHRVLKPLPNWANFCKGMAAEEEETLRNIASASESVSMRHEMVFSPTLTCEIVGGDLYYVGIVQGKGIEYQKVFGRVMWSIPMASLGRK